MTITGERRRELPDSVESSAYLTDGRRLYRVVRRFSFPPEETGAVLEDCLTLEQHSFTPGELWGMRLERVVPARSRRRGEPRRQAR